MAETVRTEQLQILPEYQEKFLKDLLASTEARAGEATVIPERQVAQLSDAQKRAIELGTEGVAAYLPMMQAGEQTLGAGAGAIEQGIQTAQAQAGFDAARQTQLERQYEPYQRIGFMSDIFRGVPTTSSTIQSQTAPSPSTASQVAGIGMGIAGLSQAGLFGEGGLGGMLGSLI